MIPLDSMCNCKNTNKNLVVTKGEVLCEKLPKHWAAESQWTKGIILKLFIQVLLVHWTWGKTLNTSYSLIMNNFLPWNEASTARSWKGYLRGRHAIWGGGQETVLGRKFPSRTWLKIHSLKTRGIQSTVFLNSFQVSSCGQYCCYGEKRWLVWDQIRGRAKNWRNEVFDVNWMTLSKCHPDGEIAVLEMVHRHGFFQEVWARVLWWRNMAICLEKPKLYSENRAAASAIRMYNLSTWTNPNKGRLHWEQGSRTGASLWDRSIQTPKIFRNLWQTKNQGGFCFPATYKGIQIRVGPMH